MKKHKDNSDQLGDFTTTALVIPISLLAIGIGLVSTFVAWGLLRLIAFFTNIFYYGRMSTAVASPAGNHLGWFAVLIPAAGGARHRAGWPRYGPEGGIALHSAIFVYRLGKDGKTATLINRRIEFPNNVCGACG